MFGRPTNCDERGEEVAERKKFGQIAEKTA